MREIVFDTETTGISPHDGHRLVEIGAIELFNKVETGRRFHVYINPERAMPSDAFAIHGLSDAFLAAKRLFADECEAFLEFIEDSPLIAHNANFDFNFMNHEFGRCGRPALCETRKIDTLAIARSKHPGAKHSLDALCMRYGVDRSQRVLHGALLDAQLLAQVYVELTGGRQIGLTLAADSENGGVDPDIATAQPDRPVRPARPHSASAAELHRHAAFVAQLTDPLWPSEAA